MSANLKDYFSIGNLQRIFNSTEEEYKAQYPFHYAVKTDPIVALELIESGVNIDERDNKGDTPLIIAVKEGTFETVAMLLYYNADATIFSENDMSPFMYSLERGNVDMQEQLFEYETVFDGDDHFLWLAVVKDSPYAIDIARKHIDKASAEYALYECHDDKHFEVFCQLWDLMYERNIMISPFNFILNDYLAVEDYNIFRYLMESKSIFNYIQTFTATDVIYFLKATYHGFPQEDAEKAIYILLCNGWIVERGLLDYVYLNFGYCELFKILIHMDNKVQATSDIELLIPYLIYQIHPSVDFLDIVNRYANEISLEFDYEQNRSVQEKIEYIIRNVTRYCVNRELYHKLSDLADCHRVNVDDALKEKLSCTVPSLIELSRNQLKSAICLKFHMTTSRKFYTYIQHINIPYVIKQIISMELPVYY